MTTTRPDRRKPWPRGARHIRLQTEHTATDADADLAEVSALLDRAERHLFTNQQLAYEQLLKAQRGLADARRKLTTIHRLMVEAGQMGLDDTE